MRRRFLLIASALGLLSPTLAQAQQPNVLLIMADDMGYSDLGCYGGEIDTPHLNRLASNGIRFTDCYNTGRCCPSRASLLTGLYPHQAGMGWMTSANLQREGYRGELSEACVTIAEALSQQGYGTYMAGKWHLTRYDNEGQGGNQSSWPLQRGFHQFSGSLRGGNYFGPDTIVEGNKRVKAEGADYYYTDAITSKGTQFLKQHQSATPQKPFFCYVAYTAPHWPLQVPGDAAAKYRQRYALGWDQLRRQRFQRLKRLGLLPANAQLPARDQAMPAWHSLKPEEQENLVERMAIYAAQVERMDAGIGKLIAELEASRQLSNTLILFVSDNGASAEGGPSGFERRPGGTLGTADSFASYGKGWASLSNTPFRGYKHFVHEGGIATPFIAHWPRKIFDRGRVRKDPTHFIDIMPTILEAAKATQPDKRLGKAVPAMEGRSLMPVFKGMTADRRLLYWEHEGHRAVRQDHWKLVSKFGKPWELYHLGQDRTETRDVASQYPDIVKQLSGNWQSYATRTGVLPLDGRPWAERVPPELATLTVTAPVNPSLPELPAMGGAPSAALLPLRPPQPNVVVILCDDLGYGDLGCYGSDKHRTPNIDRMAEEGMLLTSFYSTSGFCTPSRASLLTGCYPRRVSMDQNHKPPGNSSMRQVLFPVAMKGLHPTEITIAEALKSQGYATACIGKWHLGDQKVFLPTRQGFDSYFGIPYSNDMGTKQFPINPPLPLLRNEDVIEAPVDQTTLTRRYTEEAISFITKHQDDPFFLYLPHTMPHNPVHVSEEFKDQSENGLYADSVEEIDWSTGKILDTLDELNLSGRTLVIFTSDNGAAKRWGGSNAPLSGFKGGVKEGGMRVPCIAHWPGQITGMQRSSALATTMDLFPTLVSLTGGDLPEDREIDGHDIWPILSDSGDLPAHSVFYYYREDQLQAVRFEEWKLYLPIAPVNPSANASAKTVPRLYNLEKDIGETTDLAAKHADVVEQILELATLAREDLGDRGQAGKGVRPAGLVDRPVPLVKP